MNLQLNTPDKRKCDATWIGFALGMLAPFLTLYVFYLIKYIHLTFYDFFMDILIATNIITPAISLCVITNLLVFFIFIWTNRNFSARGVLFSTFVYAGFVVYKKYL